MCSGSLADVERLGGGHLHPVGQLEALDAGGQLGLVRRAAPGARRLSLAEQVELGPLLRRRSCPAAR